MRIAIGTGYKSVTTEIAKLLVDTNHNISKTYFRGLLLQKEFDIVIMSPKLKGDDNDPKLELFNLLRELRKRNIRVIFIAGAEHELIPELIKLQIMDIIVNPVTPENIVHTIENPMKFSDIEQYVKKSNIKEEQLSDKPIDYKKEEVVVEIIEDSPAEKNNPKKKSNKISSFLRGKKDNKPVGEAIPVEEEVEVNTEVENNNNSEEEVPIVEVTQNEPSLDSFTISEIEELVASQEQNEQQKTISENNSTNDTKEEAKVVPIEKPQTTITEPVVEVVNISQTVDPVVKEVIKVVEPINQSKPKEESRQEELKKSLEVTKEFSDDSEIEGLYTEKVNKKKSEKRTLFGKKNQKQVEKVEIEMTTIEEDIQPEDDYDNFDDEIEKLYHKNKTSKPSQTSKKGIFTKKPKVTKEPKEEKEVVKVVEPIRQTSRVRTLPMEENLRIAIQGVTHRAGTTHTSLMLGFYFATYGVSVAVVNLSDSNQSFTWLEEMFKGKQTKKTKFSHRKIDFYKSINDNEVPTLNTDYRVVIYDLGVDISRSIVTENVFNFATRRVVMFDGSFLNRHDIIDFIRRCRDTKGYMFVARNISHTMVKYFKNFIDAKEVFSFPDSQDFQILSEETMNQIEDVIIKRRTVRR